MNMSFSMTKRQMHARTKFVTRRLGWWKLQPGQVLYAIEQGQGLKKGEKVKYIACIRVISARSEPLHEIRAGDVVLEGFPEMSVPDFVTMFCQHHKCSPNETIRRIQFEFV